MSLELTCKMVNTLPEQTGTGKNGQWVKMDVIVETEEQYPKKVCLSAWGDMVQQFKNFGFGTRLKVNFRVESREYNGRWYTDVRPWKAEALDGIAAPGMGATAPAAATAMPTPAMQETISNTVTPDDDLPF